MKNTVSINSVELINADCLQYLATLPDNTIDLIVTDPPYFKVKPNGWDNQWNGDARLLPFYLCVREDVAFCPERAVLR